MIITILLFSLSSFIIFALLFYSSLTDVQKDMYKNDEIGAEETLATHTTYQSIVLNLATISWMSTVVHATLAAAMGVKEWL